MLALGIVAGCAIQSVESSVFNSEELATDAITGATDAFNKYYAIETNGASADKLAQLNATRATIYSRVEEAGVGLQTVSSLLTQYEANQSSTNEAAVLLALSAVQAQTSNVTTLVTASMSTNAP